ncbi:MAG: hypothetical protein JJE52_00320 [Acidimicrobiia bacterium]|nr:hypothetical protein [Acidimicrobiia bacterium]
MLDPFTRHDLEALCAVVTDAWRGGADRDWSAPAGTLEWSCARTADHVVDSVFAVGVLLASRRTDAYPEWSAPVSLGPSARPEHLTEALATVTRLVSGAVAGAEPEVRAVIWRRPHVEERGPQDFPPRAGLELVLHGHDVCAGLGIELVPPTELCERLRQHTASWPHWTSPGWDPLTLTGDPWADLLRASGRS